MTSLSSIKDRMTSMKAEIDESNRIVRELQTETEAHTQRGDEAQEKIKELNSTLIRLDDSKSTAEDEVKELKLKINEIETESDENYRFTRVLESHESKNNVRIADLTALLTQQSSDIERLDHLNSELQSKVQDSEDRLENAEEKGLHLKSVLEDHLEELNQLRNNYKSVNASYKKKTESVDQKKAETKQINDKQAEAHNRTCHAEDNVKCLQKQVCILEDELEEENNKIRCTKMELEQTLADLRDI